MEISTFNKWKDDKIELEESALSGDAADKYAIDKGLEVKVIGSGESELINNGSIESDLIDVLASLEKMTGFNFIITAGNDDYHKNSTSLHKTGMAIDIASEQLNNQGNRLKLEQAIIKLMVDGTYNKNGLRLGSINEYDKPSAKSTGGHFHFSLSPDDIKRDGYECNLSLSKITSYSQIRKMKEGGSSNVEVNPEIKATRLTHKANNKYFKIYDKANRKVVILKITHGKLAIYTKKKDRVGTFLLDDNGDVQLKSKSTDPILTSDNTFKIVKRIFKSVKNVFKSNTNNTEDTASNTNDIPDVNTDSLKFNHNYSGVKANNIAIIEKAALDAGITNKYAIVAMLGVIGKESGFIPKTENMMYSKERLPEVWGYFSKTGKRVPKGTGKLNFNKKAVKYSNHPEKLANFKYANKYGNGNETSGDGFKYRGRGFNQITFKNTYAKYGKLIGINLVETPDVLNKPDIAAKVAVQFFLNTLKRHNVNPNSFSDIDTAINKFARANAGWGNNPSNAIANTQKINKNFTIV